MELIITHRNPDFDAVACQVAARKLFPDALMVVDGAVPSGVRQFLALHKDFFELTPLKEVDLTEVTRAVFVDVRRVALLRGVQPLLDRIAAGDDTLDVRVFDHHDAPAESVVSGAGVVAPVGAATTLLVEELRRQEIPINPVKATLYALGIHSDTGSLTYSTTTPRDVEALAHCVSRGASADAVRYFLHPPLSTRQRQLLAALITRTTRMQIGGVKIGLGTVPIEKATQDLSAVVSTALALEGHDALFAFFPRAKHVTLVGRSRVPSVDMGAILGALGGGGHHGAGAVTLKQTSLQAAKSRLMEVLSARPPRPHRVRQVMSTPVYTMTPEMSLEELEEAFELHKISGAPVLKDGAMVGIISRRDTGAARRAGRLHLPVGSCMAQSVLTTTPDAPVNRAFEKMSEADVGRLPVIENGAIIGIVTRRDVLEGLYPERRGEDAR